MSNHTEEKDNQLLLFKEYRTDLKWSEFEDIRRIESIFQFSEYSA
ncbi:hypothetical protein CRE_21563 [Caenorhabditis remanei]|uniref:Uncharacterized protein n=1 Tax=Caenorhabditis remanei TaxID=31234 RepID=E3NFM6_CAERE|nr:hypothetical protein CRE_21563 [Caenorhabditis remanei]